MHRRERVQSCVSECKLSGEGRHARDGRAERRGGHESRHSTVRRPDERDPLRAELLQLVDGAAHVRDGAAHSAVRAAAREAERAQVDEQHVEAAVRQHGAVGLPAAEVGRRLVQQHESPVAPSRLGAVEQRPVRCLEPQGPPLRVRAAARRDGRQRRPLHRLRVLASAAREQQREERKPEALHIRSGASTPIRSRQRAITCCVARTSARRNSRCSLSSTRCS